MEIIETLNNEELSNKEKLKAVKDLVKEVRKTYGNDDLDITTVKVHTTEGLTPLSLLTNDEKVAVASQELKRIITRATAVTEATEGALFDRSFEAFVAVNPILCNINEKSTSKY